jgi:hypothetical protein
MFSCTHWLTITFCLQILSNAPLPEKESAFFALLNDYFPCFFDIKVSDTGHAATRATSELHDACALLLNL